MSKFVKSLIGDSVLYVISSPKKNKHILAIDLDSKTLAVKKVPLYCIDDRKPKFREIFFSLRKRKFYKGKKETKGKYKKIKKGVEKLRSQVQA